MSDPLHIVHSEEQPTFAELRQQYRDENQKRVHAMLREDTITFRDAAGNYLRDKDGNVVTRKTGYLTDRPAGQDHRRLDEARAQGQVIPQFLNDFIIPDAPGLDRELRDLARDAEALGKSEGILHPSERVGDPSLAKLDDESVVGYIDEAKESSDV